MFGGHVRAASGISSRRKAVVKSEDWWRPAASWRGDFQIKFCNPAGNLSEEII
jgi:hypothetical protein